MHFSKFLLLGLTTLSFALAKPTKMKDPSNCPENYDCENNGMSCVRCDLDDKSYENHDPKKTIKARPVLIKKTVTPTIKGKAPVASDFKSIAPETKKAKEVIKKEAPKAKQKFKRLKKKSKKQ